MVNNEASLQYSTPIISSDSTLTKDIASNVAVDSMQFSQSADQSGTQVNNGVSNGSNRLRFK